MGATLTTMYAAERHISLPSYTNDGGEIAVPYLDWDPGSTDHPCEAMVPEPGAPDPSPLILCGRSAAADVHAQLQSGDHHVYLASSAQPGMFLTLDNRLGYSIPKSITSDEAVALIEFVANAIAIGGGYASIYYTKRKMPFRG
ncbi:MAG: hypothetical protein L3K06_07035 [Thermoplasmata archaeon]|nr:hypothetical protein [Thermoplasmata archaeon]